MAFSTDLHRKSPVNFREHLFSQDVDGTFIRTRYTSTNPPIEVAGLKGMVDANITTFYEPEKIHKESNIVNQEGQITLTFKTANLTEKFMASQALNAIAKHFKNEHYIANIYVSNKQSTLEVLLDDRHTDPLVEITKIADEMKEQAQAHTVALEEKERTRRLRPKINSGQADKWRSSELVNLEKAPPTPGR